MKRPILVIVLNCIAIAVLGSLLVGAITLHRSGNWDNLFSGVISFNIGDNFFAADDSYEKGNGSASADGVTQIDLSWAVGNVTVKVSEEDTDEIVLAETASQELDDDEQMRWKVENGKLTIRYCKRRGFSFISLGANSPTKDLMLTIPWSMADKLDKVDLTTASGNLTASDMTADTFEVTAASGNIQLARINASVIDLTNASGSLRGENLTADEMNLDSASGKKEFIDCTISGTVDCDSASGNFYFSGSFKALDWDSASGDISLDLQKPAGRIDLDSASGDVEITLPADLPGFSVEMDSASGDMEFDFPVNYNGKHRVTYGDGSMKVEIDTASGDAEFKLK